MALNLRDLTRMAEFEIDTSAFGRVRIGNLKVSDVDAAENAHTEQQATAEEVGRMLFSRLARPLGGNDDDSPTDEESLVRIDASKIGADEVEEFTKKLAKHNGYLAKTSDGDEITKHADESHSAFLLRLILQYRVSERERWEKLMQPVTSSVFGNATRSAWAESVLASNRLGATIDALRVKHELVQPPKIVSMPPIVHPMRGTNERLDTLVDRLEDYRPALVDSAAAIVALERTVREMQANFASNSRAADRRMLRAEIVATISLVFTAFGFASSTYFSAKQVNDDSIVKALNSMRAEQQADRRDLAVALKRLSKAEKTVDAQGTRPQSQGKPSSQGLPKQSKE